MGYRARLVVTAGASLGSGAALWAVLEPGLGVDHATAVTAAAALAGVVVALGCVWAAVPGVSSTRRSQRGTGPDTGTLRAVKSFFTGRAKDWAVVEAAVDATTTRHGVRAELLIHGMPGVGKSEFSKYVAHRLLAKFSKRARKAKLEMLPEQVDLRGLEGLARKDPKDVLHGLLGKDPKLSSMDVDQLSAEWRKRLKGKFLILLLDNVDEEGQVLPFLPGGSWYVVLVTSRRLLPGLLAEGIKPIHLSPLPAEDAAKMIKSIVGREATEQDDQAIKGIAELCGCHPLAITLATVPLAGRPNVSFADRLVQLENVPDRLLAIDEYAGRESRGVAKSFELSYTQLPQESKLILRRLGLAPVPDISVEAATALADLPGDMVRSGLELLAREALIEEDARGYHLHDLVRHYARSLAGQDDSAERAAAVNRILAYYCEAAAYVDSIFTRQPPPPSIQPPAATVHHSFTDRLSTIAWARAELENMLACADHAVRSADGAGHDEENEWVVMFAGALAGILRNEGRWPRSVELQTSAIASAKQLGLPLGEANALHERGLLRRLMGDLDDAVADLEQALALYRDIGGTAGETGQAHVLNTYGVVLDQAKHPVEGRQRVNSSLDICRRLGYALGEANALNDLGMAEYFAGHYPQAVELLSQALSLYQSVDQPLGSAHAHAYLARAQRNAGLGSQAAENLEAAQALYHDLGNQLGEVTTMVELGTVLRGQRDYSRAENVLSNAIELSERIGNQLGLVTALEELGTLHDAEGDTPGAVDLWMRALEICRNHGIRREEARLREKLRSRGLLGNAEADDE